MSKRIKRQNKKEKDELDQLSGSSPLSRVQELELQVKTLSEAVDNLLALQKLPSFKTPIRMSATCLKTQTDKRDSDGSEEDRADAQDFDAISGISTQQLMFKTASIASDLSVVEKSAPSFAKFSYCYSS